MTTKTETEDVCRVCGEELGNTVGTICDECVTVKEIGKINSTRYYATAAGPTVYVYPNVRKDMAYPVEVMFPIEVAITKEEVATRMKEGFPSV